MKKIILSLLILLQVLLTNKFYISFAAATPGGDGGGGGSSGSLENPTLGMMSGIIGRIFNSALIAAGVILVAMIAYGIWKSSIATGDPRGLEGAKQTWTYALYGFFVIVLFFSIYMIAANIFGIQGVATPGAVLSQVFSSIDALLGIPK